MTQAPNVAATLWQSKRFAPLSSEAKVLYLFLNTNDLANEHGAYQLPEQHAVALLGWSVSKYRETMVALERASLISYDPDYQMVYVVRWLQAPAVTGASMQEGGDA